MNYKSQLKGWAVDRIIELQKVSAAGIATTDDLIREADKLAQFAYVLDEDLDSTAKQFLELLRQAPDDADTAGLIANMIVTLDNIQGQMSHFPQPKAVQNELQ